MLGSQHLRSWMYAVKSSCRFLLFCRCSRCCCRCWCWCCWRCCWFRRVGLFARSDILLGSAFCQCQTTLQEERAVAEAMREATTHASEGTYDLSAHAFSTGFIHSVVVVLSQIGIFQIRLDASVSPLPWWHGCQGCTCEPHFPSYESRATICESFFFHGVNRRLTSS